MNSIWIPIMYKKEYNNSKEKGIRLHFRKGVKDEVRQFCKNFCKWLRTLYWFPIRCDIKIFDWTRFMASDGKPCTALFRYFGDDQDGNVSNTPIIFVATGCYESAIKKREKRIVLFNFLASIVHELTHYYQWYFLNNDKRTNRSLEYEATRWTNYLLDEYWAKLYGQGDGEVNPTQGDGSN